MGFKKLLNRKEKELSSQSVDGRDSKRPSKNSTNVPQHMLVTYLKKVKVRSVRLSKNITVK